MTNSQRGVSTPSVVTTWSRALTRRNASCVMRLRCDIVRRCGILVATMDASLILRHLMPIPWWQQMAKNLPGHVPQITFGREILRFSDRRQAGIRCRQGFDDPVHFLRFIEPARQIMIGHRHDSSAALILADSLTARSLRIGDSGTSTVPMAAAHSCAIRSRMAVRLPSRTPEAFRAFTMA